MPDYSQVSPSFWTDEQVRSWSDDGRLLALYVLTCEHRRTEGLFRLPLAYIQDDLQWTGERLAKPFGTLVEADFIRYDFGVQVVLVVNALKWAPRPNPNQVTSAIRHLEKLPRTSLTSDFRTLAERFCKPLAGRLPKGFGSLPEGSPALALPLPPTPALPSDPTPAAPAVVAPVTAQQIVGAYIDRYGKPTQRIVGHLAKQLKEALEAEIALEHVLGGLEDWHGRDQHPSTLASFIDVRRRNGQPRTSTRAERGRQQLIDTHRALEAWAQRKEAERDRAGMDRDGGQAQRELPEPGAPAGDGAGVVRGAGDLPGRRGVAGDPPLPPRT